MAPTSRRNNRARVPILQDKLVVVSPQHDKACMLCGRKEISEMLYGTLYQLKDIVIHYYCLLLSSESVQKGTDEEGLLGFLLKDIKAELTRGAKESCFYCHKMGATISCCKPKCEKKFHLPCGLENGSMHQYFDSFKSYCQHHCIVQIVNSKYIQNTTPAQCSICIEDVEARTIRSSIWAPCCKRNAWFHRTCVQELALSTGYLFKCPLCNNEKIFKKRMLTLGIYIPSRDASWETEPNAFAELLERHSSCNTDICLCPYPNKRQFNVNGGAWEIVLCHTCGSNGTHVLCSFLKCDEEWSCKSCCNATVNINVNCEQVGFQESVENAGTSQLQPTTPPLDAHTRKNNKRCYICSITFPTVYRFEQHMINFHFPKHNLLNNSDNKDFIFTRTIKPTCKTYWIKNKNVFEEFENNLDNEIINEEYSCKICNILFSSPSEYNNHEIIHYNC